MANVIETTFTGDVSSLEESITRVGSSTVSMADGAQGGADRIRNSFDSIEDQTGTMEAAFIGFSDILTGQGDLMTAFAEGDVAGVSMAFADLAGGVSGMAPVIGNMAATFANLGVVQKASAAAQWLWNAAMSANPIGIVVLAIAGLVAGIILAYNNIGWFKDGVNAAFSFIGSFVGGVVNGIVAAWQGAVGFFHSGANAIVGVFSGIGNGIRNAFSGAFGFIRDMWNNTVGRISFSIPSWVPVIGGASFSMPRFHTGGTVPGGAGQEVMAILQAGEKVVPRTQSSSSGGGGRVTFAGNTDSALATVFMRLIRTGQIRID